MSTVVIAAPGYLGAIKERGEFRDALTFADTDALRALQAITRQRPPLIVLESGFAATSRGTALIHRIKADPTLRECEVRVVSIESQPGATAAAPIEPPGSASPAAAPPVAPAPPPAADGAPALDQEGTRRAERYDIRSGIELLVDGNPATLVDISTTGAQLMSPTSLKPNQRVRLTLPGAVPVRVNGEITWAVFEMPRTGACYRAGLVFVDPDVASIIGFIVANRKS